MCLSRASQLGGAGNHTRNVLPPVPPTSSVEVYIKFPVIGLFK